LYVPRRQSPGSALQQGIALFEGAAVALPDREKRLFHVEQSPIDELPPILRPASQQAITLLMNGYQRHVRGEIGQSRYGRTASSHLNHAVISTELQPQRNYPSGGLQLCEQLSACPLVADGFRQLGRAKRFTA